MFADVSGTLNQPAVPAASVKALSCFHCGEPCPDRQQTSGGKSFCCQGCLIVHDLINQNGLQEFYSLSQHPGVRQSKAREQDQWVYLDEPALQQRLLDFSDGNQSRITLRIPAIHCVACVWLLENLFRLHAGVLSARVNFLRREVQVVFAPARIKLSELAVLLTSIGYEPSLNLGELERREQNPARRRQWLQVGLAGFAFGNIMLFSLPVYLGLDHFNGPTFTTLFGYLSLVLALPVLIFSASDYWKSAFLSLRGRTLTLDVPIALGLAALYLTSAYEVFVGHGENYLDSMAGLIFFLLCGRVFQQKTHDRLAFDRDYKSFFPLSVRRKTPNGAAEENVSLSRLAVGDHVIIRNGELVPADARVIAGEALIDYSFVTGESDPVAKQPGDHLYAGGKQLGAAIEIETVKAVSQSYLTSLWNHETFQKKRDYTFDTLTNRYSRRFTWLVITIALGSALCWTVAGDAPRGLKAFTSVLIVACPCALALSAPFTLGTAQRLLARAKVFLKNAHVIERMARVDAVVFDKTGTLTAAGARGVSFDGPPLSPEERGWIGALTRQSTHPLSVRLSEELSAVSGEVVQTFVEIPGRGLSGRIGGREILLGSRAWLQSRSITMPAAAGSRDSVVAVAIDGKFRGTFAVSGNLRAHAGELIQNLASEYEVALLSGDNERERERFRGLFGGDAQLHFNQSPLDKLGFISRLQDSGRTVMMVGDGLNDAGALKQSDVGVAVVENVGAFSPGSDVILEAGNVPRLFEILALARRSARIVRAGFVVSAAYNLVGVSIAAAGILSPLICAVLMPVSSISVVLFACGTTSWTARRILRAASAGGVRPKTPTVVPALSLPLVEVRP
ncbi:MAG: heavy metal translocating P-type ATPase metal-binding domain-containing protein [Verrucomicrobiota bacterium]